MLLAAAALARPAFHRHAIYVSRDFGHTWAPADSGLPAKLQVSFLEAWGDRLAVATEDQGLFVGVPGRGRWTRAGIGLPGVKITALHLSDPWLYVGVYQSGIFASDDGGRSWDSLNRGLPDLRVRAIMTIDGGVLVGTDSGIFMNRNGQPAWKRVFAEGQIVDLNKSGRRLVAGGALGTVLSEDEGKTWRWIHRPGAARNTAIIGGRIVLMKISGDLLTSDDWGSTWSSQAYAPRERSYVYEVVRAGSRLVASNNYGIHTSDGRAGWDHVFKTEELVFIDLVTMNGVIYGGTKDWRERRSRSS